MRKLLVALILMAVPVAFAQERIIPLYGDITEIIFALGAGDQIVAVDASSNYPAETLDLPNVGYVGQLGVETLLVYEPTLVIATPETRPRQVLDSLREAGVTVVEAGKDPTLETPITNIRLVAGLLGKEAEGEALIASFQADLAAAAERGAALEYQPRVIFLYLGSQTMHFAGGDETASNAMIEGAGGLDVGKEAGYTGYAPFTAESLIAAAPDVIIVTERGLNTVGGIEGVLEIPGVSLTPAGMAGNVISFEDLYFIGMGPRTAGAVTELVEFFESIQ